MSPEAFERRVRDFLRRLARRHRAQGLDIEVTGKRDLTTADGSEYEIDVTARMEVLSVELVFLVECKHHARTVPRDYVNALESKCRDLSAHKAIMFSTGGFQSGAIEFAAKKRIALIQVVGKRWVTINKRLGAELPAEATDDSAELVLCIDTRDGKRELLLDDDDAANDQMLDQVLELETDQE